MTVISISELFKREDLYYGHGTDNPWDEAVQLVFALLGLPFDTPKSELDAPVPVEKVSEIEEAVRKRIHMRLPLPYITHEAYLSHLTFYVDERVIIPRSPIAELIEAQFYPWLQQPEKVKRMLDMCTGSACLAILMSKYFRTCQIDAVDISSDALDVAQINRERHGVENEVTLIQSDLFQAITPSQQYDVIIANPPYVDDDDFANMPCEYEAEPRLALHADDEGLAIVDRLLAEAARYLTDNGIIIMEVGNSQHALEIKYPNLPFIWLAFERGGQGVFLLERRDLLALSQK